MFPQQNISLKIQFFFLNKNNLVLPTKLFRVGVNIVCVVWVITIYYSFSGPLFFKQLIFFQRSPGPWQAPPCLLCGCLLWPFSTLLNEWYPSYFLFQCSLCYIYWKKMFCLLLCFLWVKTIFRKVRFVICFFIPWIRMFGICVLWKKQVIHICFFFSTIYHILKLQKTTTYCCQNWQQFHKMLSILVKISLNSWMCNTVSIYVFKKSVFGNNYTV